MENYAFQIRVSNDRNDDLQNITGEYVASGTAAACEAGFLCNKGERLAEGGYKMTSATNGAEKLYACNPSDVQRVAVGDNIYAIGIKTLGLGILKGVKDTFTELKVGEVYAFGPGNFSTLVSTTNKYATVANGLLVGTSDLPGDGYFFELDTGLGIDVFTEGCEEAFARYNLELKYKKGAE